MFLTRDDPLPEGLDATNKEVTATKLGEALNLGPRQIQRLAVEGVIVRGASHGRYDLHRSISNYVAHLRDKIIFRELDKRAEYFG